MKVTRDNRGTMTSEDRQKRIEELQNRGPNERRIEHPDIEPSAEDAKELRELDRLRELTQRGMESVTITIRTANAAFQSDAPCVGFEVARILHKLADEIKPEGSDGYWDLTLHDINGNTVGEVTTT